MTTGGAGVIHYQKIMDDLKASEYAGLDEQIEPIPHLIQKKVATKRVELESFLYQYGPHSQIF
jgi:hypothetical protein